MRGVRPRRWKPVLFAAFLLALSVAFHGTPETGFQDIAEAITWLPTPEELVCRSCHTGGADQTMADAHHLLLQTAEGCFRCHGYQNIDGVISIPVHHDCTFCHGTGYNHPNARHTKVSGVDKCVICHEGDRIVNIHRSNCLACHRSARPQVVQAISTKNGGTCETCHVSGHVTTVSLTALHDLGAQCFYCHSVHGALMPHFYLATSPNCSNCHTGTNVLAIHQDNCLTCHLPADPAKLATLLALRNNPVGIQANCETCHGSEYSHPAAQ